MCSARSLAVFLVLGAAGCAQPVVESDTITVMLNNGQASFERFSYPATEPRTMAIGDLNGDSFADVLVIERDGLGVLWGKGNGPPDARSDLITLSGHPSCIGIENLDGDQRADIVVGSSDDATVSVLLNDGDGLFHIAGEYAAPEIRSLVIGDYNGDGYQDVAFGVRGAVNVLENRGDGVFSAKAASGAGTATYSVSAADFNADGVTDLVMADLASLDRGDVRFWVGRGDGTFDPGVAYDDVAIRTVRAARVTLDNTADVIGTGNGILLLVGDGNGGFGSEFPYVSDSPLSVAVGDFNKDGIQDLAGIRARGGIGIRLGVGDGTFLPESSHDAGPSPQELLATDLDHDGFLDLVVTSAGTPAPL